MINSVSVKNLLILAFSALALAVLLVIAISLQQLDAANSRLSAQVNGTLSRISRILTVRVIADRRAIDERDMLLVRTPQERASLLKDGGKADSDLQDRLQSLSDAIRADSNSTDRERQLFADVQQTVVKYRAASNQVYSLLAGAKDQEAVTQINAQDRVLMAALVEATRVYALYDRERADASLKDAAQAYTTQRDLLFGCGGTALLFACALGWAIPRRLTRVLGAEPAQLGDVASRVAAGDLRPIREASSARTGSVLASMGIMQARLVALIGEVRSSAESVAIASSQIAQGNIDLSHRTEHQAAALQVTAAAMEELGAAVRQTSAHALSTDQLAQTTCQQAVKGVEVVNEVVQTMKAIDGSSKRIADIIGAIDGIAFQTNILALNAAAEAAHAGQHGRGFAVVAAEVRRLAGRTTDAAKEIKKLIDGSVEQVGRGSVQADLAGTTMSEVMGSIQRVTEIMGKISAATAEQSNEVSRVSEAVTRMDHGTQQNAALVEQSAAAAESLKHQAQHLVQTVAVFKLD